MEVTEWVKPRGGGASIADAKRVIAKARNMETNSPKGSMENWPPMVGNLIDIWPQFSYRWEIERAIWKKRRQWTSQEREEMETWKQVTGCRENWLHLVYRNQRKWRFIPHKRPEVENWKIVAQTLQLLSSEENETNHQLYHSVDGTRLKDKITENAKSELKALQSNLNKV
jgi:hypothetical protein